ncbi:MAG: DHH family phosphoesterase, partial [Proteobacteria bacterium]|nr:DHH family phosphoesterase [Pseudomonadota bacterium]
MQLSDLSSRILDNPLPVIISTHQNPDGDALGSEIALAHCLKKLGKEVILVNQDRVPTAFKFLEEYERIKSTPEIISVPEKAQVIIADTHDIDTTGSDIKELLAAVK